MAHLWVQNQSEAESADQWAIVPLDDDREVLFLNDDSVAPLSGSLSAATRASLHRRRADGEADQWILLASPVVPVSVNGLPLALRMRLLQNQDEVKVPGLPTVIFATDDVARAEQFPGLGRPARCPRCQRVIDQGTPAVRCPQCGIWHHQDQSAELGCWTYDQTCAMCSQPTALDGGYGWTPEEF